MNFSFKCDSTSLDFLGTLRARRDPQPTELLLAPEDASAWFQQAGVVDEPLEFGEAEFARALELREAVWGVVASRLSGDSLPVHDLEVVNAAAAEPAPVPQLGADGRRVSATPEQALSAIARDAIEILTGDGVIKECSRPGCTQVYLDRSRGSRREWCSMDPCGNRVKARDYRARKAATAS